MMMQGKASRCWLLACVLLAVGCGAPAPRRATSLSDMVGYETVLTGTLRGPGRYGTILVTSIGEVYLVSAPDGVGSPTWSVDRNYQNTLYTVTGVLRHQPAGVDDDLRPTEEFYYFDDATTKVEIAASSR